MKITIDVSDWYHDDDMNLEESLKQAVIRQVTSEVQSQIKEQVRCAITELLISEFREQVTENVSSLIKELLESKTMRPRYGGSESVTMHEYFVGIFSNESYTRDLDGAISKIAKTHAENIKSRYDMLFASSIVSKLQEHGMLKEDVAKLILETNK